MSASDCQPLIVSGAPRSGTSMLYNLFDGHPEVSWLVDEGFLFEYLDTLGPEGLEIFLDAVPDATADIVAGLRDKQVIPPAHLPYRQSKARGSVSEVEFEADWDETAFRGALEGTRPEDAAGLWRWLARACLAGMGEAPRRFACMKSPDYGKSAAGALDTIADARAVVIFRDPLHAIDSLKRSRELRGEKLLTWPLIAQNIRDFQRMQERVQQADPDRIRALRYETLVARPEETMRDLADWLGIAFDACLLEPTMRGKHWPGISSFTPTDGIEAAPAKRGVQSLSGDEQALIRRHLAEFRETYDYD